MTKEQKSFNATPEGQREMFRDADSRSTAFMMSKIIKSKGGDGWPDQMIATANETLLRAIKEDLVSEYNKIIGGGL